MKDRDGDLPAQGLGQFFKAPGCLRQAGPGGLEVLELIDQQDQIVRDRLEGKAADPAVMADGLDDLPGSAGSGRRPDGRTPPG